MAQDFLNFAEYGPPGALPVFVFHGTPGSRFEQPLDLSLCEQLNCRLIVVERAGYGVSDFDGQRKLLDFPAQVARLADKLGIHRFSILGFSGGGPYALVCGAFIAERIARIALVGSFAPFTLPGVLDHMAPGNRALFELAAADYRAVEEQLAQLVDGADGLLQLFDASVSTPDQALLCDEKIRTVYRANLAEALRQGMAGMAYDMGLLGQPWGFEPSDVRVEVDLWHGDKDLNVPSDMGRKLTQLIPHCRSNFIADAGHWLIFSHYQQILQSLVQAGGHQN